MSVLIRSRHGEFNKSINSTRQIKPRFGENLILSTGRKMSHFSNPKVNILFKKIFAVKNFRIQISNSP